MKILNHLTLLSIAGAAALALPTAGLAQVSMEVSLANPRPEAGKTGTTFLKVGLTGGEVRPDENRPPANVALVIDQSGSMAGDKIEQAREAARMAVETLGADDILSVIAYSSGVDVLVPATKLTDKAEVLRQIKGLRADGNTALYAGVARGAAEVRKFLSDQQINRVILLSDGLANEGPRSPEELGHFGAELLEEGISVTTIGLGLDYNEDLMAQLAVESHGNHVFVQEEAQLAHVFSEEFGDILSVCAQEVEIEIECAEGIRPVRVMGREANIEGQKVTVSMSQIYAEQEKYVLLEVEVPEGEAGAARNVAEVRLSYANMASSTTDELAASVDLRFAGSPEEAAAHVDKEVMASVVLQIATDNNEVAMRLRDEGKVEEAKAALEGNCHYLNSNNAVLNDARLSGYALENAEDAAAVEDAHAWGVRRKGMRSWQNANRIQQSSNTGQ